MNNIFRVIAHHISEWMGSAYSFIGAIVIVLVWVATGPVFNFSDTWQLVINTGTTILTFLMVFLVQNTQNRDNKVIQLKLDELIRTMSKARGSLVDLEDAPDSQIQKLTKEFEKLRSGLGSKK